MADSRTRPYRVIQWFTGDIACHQIRLDAGNSSLAGTGLNPGLSFELAVLGSSLCHEVESIHIKTCERQSTMSPIFIEKFGFDRTEEDLRAGEDGAAEIFDRPAPRRSTRSRWW